MAIFSFLFVPLTFIVGLYGMNFKYMPELNHPLGYPAVLALMLIVAVGMPVFSSGKNGFKP
jgi:magnesium transporter